jgi:hypothetical protein
MMKDIQKEKQPNMTVYYGGDWVTEMEIMDTIYSDAMYAIGSFTLVFFFMVLHTESLFLSFTALVQILLSFPTYAPSDLPHQVPPFNVIPPSAFTSSTAWCLESLGSEFSTLLAFLSSWALEWTTFSSSTMYSRRPLIYRI